MAGLLLGDLLAGLGTGMIIVAMPVQTLSLHGSVPKAIAIGLVEAAPFVLSTVLALAVGLGRVRVPPRTLLVADCVLRSLTFTALGVLAVTGRLTLPVPLRRDGQAGRVEQPPPAGDGSRGRVVATAGAGYALFFDAGGALVLLAATSVFVPRSAAGPDALREPKTSGWRILRRRPVAPRRPADRTGRQHRRARAVRGADAPAAPDRGLGRPRPYRRKGTDMCLSLKAAAHEHFRELTQLRRVRDRIGCAAILDLEALARDAGMTAEHLTRRFRLAYGCSPHAYRELARAIRNREAHVAEPAVA
ncbi:AraC family transcriptional regulator [Amycolatopsis sp. NBC_01488]|uniref:hypothetical protein n=1 Tax=Amycolatopsis sp. NBC_01488 TaxID=2903563 RepID=UPI002E2E5AEA|nr:hypothetical protein [Amycolatopsis sp. NBC_01488]